MDLQQLFSARDVVVDFSPADKWEAIRLLVEHLAATGRLAEDRVEDVLEAVISRERSMSTGMENGIAIPHAAVDEITEAVGAIGLLPDPGLPFDSADGQNARVVVALVIPRAQKLLHIRTIGAVARMFSRPEVREKVLASTTREEAFESMVAADEAGAS